MRIAATLALVTLPVVVLAHPLGNFTVNRYAALGVEPDAIAIRYVVDMAEIPAFQSIRAADTDGDGSFGPRERVAWARRMTDELRRGLVLTLDGVPLDLTAGEASLELPPGAGGLPTLRLDVPFRAVLAHAAGTVEFADRNFAGRAGWQEVVAVPRGALALAHSSVPAVDQSEALRSYPTERLASPPQVTSARFEIANVGPGAPRGAAPGARVGSMRGSDRFTELLASTAPLTAGVVVTALLVAAGLGALHALSPGHGKTIVGAYLVGAHGTTRQAVLLGLVVTATHTIGVYLLGLVTLVASGWILPERLFPYLSAVSGLLVVCIGASLLSERLRAALAPAHDHEHGPGEVHDHHHDHHHHGHPHDHHHHGHSHLPPAGTPPSLRSLLALGVSGGLLPCPSALVVMLGAIALGRTAFGLVLIVAFSAGLATVLTGIGLVFVHAGRFVERVPMGGRFLRYAPIASALVISLAGLAIVLQALITIGA